MNVLITSGGTTEKIDRVRGITNHATGRLGSIMAKTFLDQGHRVTLVTTAQAIKPSDHENLTIYLVSDVASLMRHLSHWSRRMMSSFIVWQFLTTALFI